jgi:hypothetical protein
MQQRTRAFIIVITALVGLFANVVIVANDGSSGWNFVAIGCFAVMLFAGFEMVARSAPPPSPPEA